MAAMRRGGAAGITSVDTENLERKERFGGAIQYTDGHMRGERAN
jgi:hypothetical protein